MKRELVVLLLLIANAIAGWATARAPVRPPLTEPDRPVSLERARVAQTPRAYLQPRERLHTCVAL